MRSLALLLVLIAAFYVLLADQKKSVGGSARENKPSTTPAMNDESYFSEGLPEDFMPSDLARFGTIDKLQADLDYRRLKMINQIDHEMKDFKDSHDIRGKDKEAYETLLQKHKEAKAQFHDEYVEQIKEYKKKKTELYETNDKGLR